MEECSFFPPPSKSSSNVVLFVRFPACAVPADRPESSARKFLRNDANADLLEIHLENAVL